MIARISCYGKDVPGGDLAPLPNGLELSRLASPRLVSHEMADRGLAGSAPSSC